MIRAFLVALVFAVAAPCARADEWDFISRTSCDPVRGQFLVRFTTVPASPEGSEPFPPISPDLLGDIVNQPLSEQTDCTFSDGTSYRIKLNPYDWRLSVWYGKRRIWSRQAVGSGPVLLASDKVTSCRQQPYAFAQVKKYRPQIPLGAGDLLCLDEDLDTLEKADDKIEFPDDPRSFRANTTALLQTTDESFCKSLIADDGRATRRGYVGPNTPGSPDIDRLRSLGAIEVLLSEQVPPSPPLADKAIYGWLDIDSDGRNELVIWLAWKSGPNWSSVYTMPADTDLASLVTSSFEIGDIAKVLDSRRDATRIGHQIPGIADRNYNVAEPVNVGGVAMIWSSGLGRQSDEVWHASLLRPRPGGALEVVCDFEVYNEHY
ncbi:MAG: hypothetical protein QM698_17010 [Micropepsaceae bacterium]